MRKARNRGKASYIKKLEKGKKKTGKKKKGRGEVRKRSKETNIHIHSAFEVNQKGSLTKMVVVVTELHTCPSACQGS